MTNTQEITLHWIIDPLCGWSYGALSLLQATAQQWPAQFELHSGGLFMGYSRRRIDADWHLHVRDHDARIAELTGATFGEQYREHLCRDQSVVLDSLPASAAMLALQQHSGADALAFLAAAQHAWYVDGKDISQTSVLDAVAAKLGLAADVWQEARSDAAKQLASQAINRTRQLMAQHGAQGFPSLLVQRGTEYFNVPVNRFYGEPAALVQQLTQWLQA
ncbi:DsbA family protein [Shewanella avicenniae]|uniref:DsbA family protein n=1 Tax=Shewanella avicenniae TaxID=2814294 RepID=A0ABX7QMV4_9GAMM|nr:DsbA family protein [Shewanella avicenniae]QSX32347.1 DsbA family protein [Shewanella avicenniae]